MTLKRYGGEIMSDILLFRKGDKLCYSTSKTQTYNFTKREKKLVERGWKQAGSFVGRNVVGYGIPTMTEILRKEAHNGKTL